MGTRDILCILFGRISNIFEFMVNLSCCIFRACEVWKQVGVDVFELGRCFGKESAAELLAELAAVFS